MHIEIRHIEQQVGGMEHRYMLEILAVLYFAAGIDRREFQWHLIVSMEEKFVIVSLKYKRIFLQAVLQVRYSSVFFLVGYQQCIGVGDFFFIFQTSSLKINSWISMPSKSPYPWKSLSSFLAQKCSNI